MDVSSPTSHRRARRRDDGATTCARAPDARAMAAIDASTDAAPTDGARADAAEGSTTGRDFDATVSRARLHGAPRGRARGRAWPRRGRARRPGDVVFWHRVAREFFDVGFEHWAVYVGRVGVADERLGIWRWIRDGDDRDAAVECVVHLWGAPSGGEGEDGGGNRDMDANAACVLSPLADVGEDPRCGNARYDATHAPLRIGDIVDRCRLAVDQGFYEGRYGAYCVRANNCEHFATWARYGVRFSQQIEEKVETGLTIARVAASLLAQRDVGLDPNAMNMAKHLIMGTRVHPNDEEEIAAAIKDMNGGESPKYTAAEDVAYILDYLVDRVDVEVEDQLERDRERVHVPWSSRPVPASREIATLSFGRARSVRPSVPEEEESFSITAGQVSAFAGQVGRFVTQASASAFRVLGAGLEELARTSRPPPRADPPISPPATTAGEHETDS